MDNIIKTWNDKLIRFRESDGYGCLTDMAKATGKNVADWQRLKGTQDYLESLSSIMGIVITELIEVKVGGNFPKEVRGTWAHPEVCKNFSQWCLNSKNTQTEKDVSDNLSEKLNGTREVLVSCGKVDVLTDTEIIEVKQINNWITAVGQVLVYGQDYPSRTKRIHLFGEASQEVKVKILSYCQNLNILVTFES